MAYLNTCTFDHTDPNDDNNSQNEVFLLLPLVLPNFNLETSLLEGLEEYETSENQEKPTVSKTADDADRLSTANSTADQNQSTSSINTNTMEVENLVAADVSCRCQTNSSRLKPAELSP